MRPSRSDPETCMEPSPFATHHRIRRLQVLSERDMYASAAAPALAPNRSEHYYDLHRNGVALDASRGRALDDLYAQPHLERVHSEIHPPLDSPSGSRGRLTVL